MCKYINSFWLYYNLYKYIIYWYEDLFIYIIIYIYEGNMNMVVKILKIMCWCYGIGKLFFMYLMLICILCICYKCIVLLYISYDYWIIYFL